MPRLKRQSRQRRAELTFEWTFALRTGLIREGREIRKVTDDEARQWWDDATVREQIMDGHMEHYRLGWPSRPWCWWRMNHAGINAPHCLDPRCAEAATLFSLGELNADELARLPRLIATELRMRRARGDMDPPEYLTVIEAFAEQVGTATIEEVDDAK